jgi:transcriptional regulator with XRE-family HTH domain
MMPTIREMREQRGWTQAQLANMVGVHQRAVYFWESGKRMPQVPQLRRLSEVFGVSMEAVDLLESPVTGLRRGRPRKDQP